MNDPTPSPIPAYVATLVRAGAATVGGWLIGKGYITADQAPEIAGGVMALAVVVWGLIQKISAHQALASAIKAPAGKAA
jgi:hypothetical protein